MRSLRTRLLAFSALWTAVALVLAWVFIAALLRDFVTSRFSAELEAVAEAVMAGSDWQGDLVVTPPGDPRFDAPLSGWYWQVSDGAEVLAKSNSLWTADLGPGGALAGPQDVALFRHADRFTAPGESTALIVTVAMPNALLLAESDRITRPLAAALAVLGVGLVAASVLSVTAGLRVLERLREGLEAVRAGQIDALPIPRTTELRPLAEGLNRLIEENRSVIARARAHVGNLAHALKTPLSALANGGAQPELVQRMDRILRWHLKRARTAGQGRSLGQTTPVGTVLDDLMQVLARDLDGIAVTIRLPPLTFAGEREDLEEMLGNILENAVKWADGAIDVTGDGNGDTLCLTIADDGPGIPDADMPAAMLRGARLDEAVAGSGLGLAIVADLVQVYDGTLMLARNAPSGLRVTLTLPQAGGGLQSDLRKGGRFG